jgi:hypothetical protein
MAEDEKETKDQEEEDAKGQSHFGNFAGNTDEDVEGQKVKKIDAEGDDTEGQGSHKK